MAGPTIELRLPALSLFHFPPDPLPTAIPPPVGARTFASPFAIDAGLYNAALDWKVPITVGTVYATTVILLNKYNRERKFKPWAISQTRIFFAFVVLHNIFLAVFSALTFIGMIRALAHTWPGRRDLPFLGKLWPGMRTLNGLVGAADALCKMHGPGHLGDAVLYNTEAHAWMVTNRVVKLSDSHTPDNADVGRLWNEGLAFWGWWFYLSKFYEVFDTLIILAKGKRSSTLQTYHHFGAMLSMWAGMRYMSPPIWMFCFLNSFIHALMVSQSITSQQNTDYYSIRTIRSLCLTSAFLKPSSAASPPCRFRSFSSVSPLPVCTSSSTTLCRFRLHIRGLIRSALLSQLLLPLSPALHLP
jgi:GNS1/SUR4 family